MALLKNQIVREFIKALLVSQSIWISINYVWIKLNTCIVELVEFVMAQFLHFLGHSKKLQLHFFNHVLSRYTKWYPHKQVENCTSCSYVFWRDKNDRIGKKSVGYIFAATQVKLRHIFST